MPEPVAVDAPLLRYEASYKLDGRRLTVRREVEDRTPAGICPTTLTRQFRDAAQPVLKDVRQQLLYR